MNSATVTVSLEPHLKQSLNRLLPILPKELHISLQSQLNQKEIHYALLTQISRWARSDAGQSKLLSAQLSPHDYDNIVSLLAGTRTAPSSKPPPDPAPGSEESSSPEVRIRRELNDRKALVAVLNGLLSIGCAGGAAWWAADKSGWRDEWKVLVALMVATIVGVSETILLVIWQSRLSASPDRVYNVRQRIQQQQQQQPNEKSDNSGELVEPSSSPSSSSSSPQEAINTITIQDKDSHLRRRAVRY
ncbi:uncharacterized protein FOMMEDRAFT_100764 [Fomitiporia mediterranea MF3/22]|uniref:uncharacterized protein n=1 Tax=Fomitiporia mediterranea (strain MF3/22) TaxID=694068 RepID=UPI0004407AB0|nr:uncharacterized protein FOMMEDRAFT_100764 [Fomitiporia mediterranea MF3/22]EJD07498.1 hypothetical protein FOMMEDRAFT_100764 [Fomitiporia mediterranea MF3/22]